MTTCQRDEVPKLREFNCRTQSQYCPRQKDSDITIGPFVQLQPVELRRTRKNLKIKNSEYEKLYGKIIYNYVIVMLNMLHVEFTWQF